MSESAKDMTAEELTALTDIGLRREVTRALEPGPWKHTTQESIQYGDESYALRCEKCGLAFYIDSHTHCAYPDAAEGSWADLAERLLHHIVFDIYYGRAKLVGALSGFLSGLEDNEILFLSWLQMSPREHVIVCLLALQEAER